MTSWSTLPTVEEVKSSDRTIADILKGAREERGESLRGAAKSLGVDPSYLSRVETGERSPSESLQEKAESYYSLDSDAMALVAGRVPADVLRILQNHPELLDEIRERHDESR